MYSVDNHSSGYLGMAVQHCVRTHLGSHCILAQKQYCQKQMAQLNYTAFFMKFEAIKLFMKNSVTVCKIQKEFRIQKEGSSVASPIQNSQQSNILSRKRHISIKRSAS